MTILALVGPVISTRRSCRSAGIGATCHSPSRMAGGVGAEVGQLAGVERASAARARGQQRPPPRVEPAVEVRDRSSAAAREDFVVAGMRRSAATLDHIRTRLSSTAM